MYQGAFLVFGSGYYFSVWPQISHGNAGIGLLLFVGRERKGCFEVTLGIKCIGSNLKCLPLYIPNGSVYNSRYARQTTVAAVR